QRRRGRRGIDERQRLRHQYLGLDERWWRLRWSRRHDDQRRLGRCWDWTRRRQWCCDDEHHIERPNDDGHGAGRRHGDRRTDGFHTVEGGWRDLDRRSAERRAAHDWRWSGLRRIIAR